MPLDRSPWTVHRTREVYANPWIRVAESDVTRPDGRPGLYGVVRMAPATGVVALTGADEVVLVGQWRVPHDRWSWELPEGAAAPGETPLQAAQRELREETGYTAERWRPLGGEIHLSNSVTDETAHLFTATGLQLGRAAPDGDEVLEVCTVPFDEALDMVDRGEIVDAMTVIGLLRCARWRIQEWPLG